MIKKLAICLLVVVLCFLSGCALVEPVTDDPQGNLPNSSLVFDEDYVIGMFVYVEKYDSERGLYFGLPTDNFHDEKAMYLYNATINENGNVYSSVQSQGSFSGVEFAQINGGAAPDGKLAVTATFHFTYELIGATLCMENVYQKSDYTIYADSAHRYVLGEMGISSIGITQNLSRSFTYLDGTKKEVTYEGKNTLNLGFMDYLVDATIVEFDSSNNVIKTEQIDLQNTTAFTYQASAKLCLYLGGKGIRS